MERFEEVLKQYEPMISSILRKAHIYKNHEFFRQAARIALWKAWRNFDESRGSFSPYAYQMMLTTVYTSMRKDNQYSESQIPFEKDKLTTLAQTADFKMSPLEESSLLEPLVEHLSADEFQLLKDLYFDQYKYEELTDKYNASVAALKKRRDRIFKKLRQKLKEHDHIDKF
ncbi:RNA polymerase sigma factor [Lysinibacillus sp. SGAir0095]|uniref:RNA polymerase sigma factor n=1 Tax=Lysinibacillus sp. SGAir0095 TaxID=2070463 RepID=UPI0010CD6573|nr:sigma-70 family RNA polymerase sigma factor [Lysinibacillus sp. SGAir0095]QCR31894.1 hypothetical protein C1N55_06745 [Lysinibacillus sp. SGAir0095]